MTGGLFGVLQSSINCATYGSIFTRYTFDHCLIQGNQWQAKCLLHSLSFFCSLSLFTMSALLLQRTPLLGEETIPELDIKRKDSCQP